jgi:hypothetical protein
MITIKKQMIPLKEGSPTFKKWTKVEVPIYMKFYLFDVQNPEEAAEGEAPILLERGPYTFLQTRRKDNWYFENHNLEIKYKEIKGYYFLPEMSNGTLEDVITNINVPLVSLLTKVSRLVDKMSASLVKGVLKQSIDNAVRSSETLFQPKTVRELLFEGYNVQILEKISKILGGFDIKFTSPLPNNKFGLFYGKNETADGPFEVKTGIDDILEFTKLVSYKGKKTLSNWAGPYCNMINGTDGSQFHPEIDKKEILYVFNTDLCRSLFLEFQKESSVKGIPTYKFAVPDRFFTAPHNKNPGMECFCTNPKSPHKICETDGILDISRCRKGAPVALSAPHFFAGDPILRINVEGLKPEREIHETFLEIEPLTGLVLNAARRLQINILVEKSRDIEALRTVQQMVMPFLWLQESATADEGSADKFKSLIQNKIYYGKMGTILAMVLGMVIILTVIIISLIRSRSTHKYSSARSVAKIQSSEYKSLPQAKRHDGSYVSAEEETNWKATE